MGLCKIHKPGKAEVQHIIPCHDQQIIGKVQRFHGQLNISDRSQACLI